MSLGVIALSKINELKRQGAVGYEETKSVEILPETHCETEFYPDLGCAMGQLPQLQVELGDKVEVVFDGVSYKTEYKYFGSESGIGNLVFYGEEDSGEPFYIVDPQGECVLICKTDGTHTISITKVTETIHTIDHKFLPSGSVGKMQTGTVLFDVDLEDTGEGYTVAQVEISAPIVEGNYYTLKTDKGEYKGQAIYDPSSGSALINCGLVMAGGAGTSLDILAFDGGTHCTLAELKVEKIDPAFIPGAYLPFVRIANPGNITEEESLNLTKCVGSPCVIACETPGVSCGVYSFGRNFVDGSGESGPGFVCSEGGFVSMFISKDGTTWSHRFFTT